MDFENSRVMVDPTCYDVTVLGAGIQGSATAYYLTQKAGVNKVLLLEQFPALHSRGSSHGSTRIAQRGCTTPLWGKMMDEAYEMWSTLEKESGTKLYEKTGILVLFGPGHSQPVNDVTDSLTAGKIPHWKLTTSEANEKYSKQLSLPAETDCIYEDDGGILMAKKALAAYQRMFVSAGGVFLDMNPVTEIVPGQTITIRTRKGTFRTRKLAITAGPWAPSLLRTLGLELPLQPLRTESWYWKVDTPEDFCKEKIPVVISFLTEERTFCVYSIPVHEYPGLIKICTRHGVEVDPDHRDTHPHHESAKKRVADFIGEFYKGVATTPSLIEPCIYTHTPDRVPILDRHPTYPNIVIGAGFSGHGFKLSPVIGKILSELALDLPPSYDLSPFTLNRFPKDSSIKYGR